MQPYIVEYHNGAYWVHKQREWTYNSKGEKVPMTNMGDLACKEPFSKMEDAQAHADYLTKIYYKRIGRRTFK